MNDQFLPEGLLTCQTRLEQALGDILTHPGHPHPKYAIVIPVVYDEQDPYLIIEVRAEGIPQAGDPCFPGGKIEPGETPGQAAVREMSEELGITIPADRLLGQLPPVKTILGNRTDVFVCLLKPEECSHLTVNADEVAEVLQVPMSRFLAEPHASSFPEKGHVIWGMTALVIQSFCRTWRRMMQSEGGTVHEKAV